MILSQARVTTLTSPLCPQVEVGSTLQLDCPVTQLSQDQGTVMLWKKGHRVLTAGGIKVRRDPRMSLVGTDLTITGVGVHDGGLYRCEVEQDTDQPLTVVFTVEILGENSFMVWIEYL